MKIGVNRRLNLCGAIAAGGLVVVFCLILLRHDPLIFWNDDYELSILPVFADVARSWNEGHFPLLSPYSWVCSNLAGEFQYGTFSVFINAAVVFIWKFPLTFPQQAAALSITHLFVLAMGAFLLGRERGLSHALAMLVAIVTTLSGWIVCWGATDWFGALGAFAWLPWCWWGLERSLAAGLKMEGGAPATPGSRELAPPRVRRWLGAMIWPAPFVYLLVTGGFPYTVVMLGLLVGWICLREFARTRSPFSILPTLAGVALGFGLSAPAWLALLDYVHGSNRSAQSAFAHWQWLVPPAALPGFVLPSWTVNWADFSTRYVPHRAAELACGLVPPAALLWGLIFRGREFVRKIRWGLGLLVVVCALSMLPSAGVFRWSFRWLPFLHLIMVLCAAEALRVGADRGGSKSFFRGAPVFALLLVALTTAASFLFGVNGHYTGAIAICTTLMALGWVGADFSVPSLREWAPAAVAFGVLLTTYLVIPPNFGVPKYNLSQDLLNPAPLDPGRLYLSIYPPAEVVYRAENKPGPAGQIVRPGSTSMWAGLRFINGYSPILASGVAKEFGFAIHGEFDWAMQKKLLETQDGFELLTYLGVDGIVVAAESGFRPLPTDEWNEVFASDEGKVYHRKGSPSPRVMLVTSTTTGMTDAPRDGLTLIQGLVQEKIDSRTSMKFLVPGVPQERDTVLLSRPYFPGYRAKANGQEVPVGSWRGLIPSIALPTGFQGSVEVSYRPWWLVWGGAAAGCSLLLLICASVWTLRGLRKHQIPSTNIQ